MWIWFLNLLNSLSQMMFHHNTRLKRKLVYVLIVCYSCSLLHILIHLYTRPYDFCILRISGWKHHPKPRERDLSEHGNIKYTHSKYSKRRVPVQVHKKLSLESHAKLNYNTYWLQTQDVSTVLLLEVYQCTHVKPRFHYDAGFLLDMNPTSERLNSLISSSAGAFHTPAEININ